MAKAKKTTIKFTSTSLPDADIIAGFGTMEGYKAHLEADLITLNSHFSQLKNSPLSAKQQDILNTAQDIIFSIASATHSVLEDTCQSCLPVDNAIMGFSPLDFIEKLSDQYSTLAHTRQNTLVALASVDSPALIETNSIKLLKLLSAILRDVLAHNSNGTIMLEVRSTATTKYLEFVSFIIADLNTKSCLPTHKISKYNALASELEGHFIIDKLEDIGHQYRVELPIGKGTARQDLHVPYQAKMHDKRLLLVDERPFQQHMFTSLCERVNMHIKIINNAPEAIIEFEKNAKGYDFIVVNNDLPDMSGTELMEFVHIVNDAPHMFLLSNSKLNEASLSLPATCFTLPIHEQAFYSSLLEKLIDN